MAIFTGTFEEFDRFIGPRLRNLVQTSIARKYRISTTTCQEEGCIITQNLEAAHKRGCDRKTLMRTAYDALRVDNKINIEKCEEKFIGLHYPVQEHFIILCRDHHRKYDNIIDVIDGEGEGEETKIEGPINETLVIELYPSDIVEFKELLLQYKSAYIKVLYDDGSQKIKEWDASKFSENSDVIRNLRSRPEFRRGAWQASKINKIEVTINY